MSEPIKSKRRGGNPRMVKGAPSVNPHGRPRAGTALAERIRERLDPDTILDLARQLADDESIPIDKRLDSILRLAAMGYLKPPSEHRIEATTTPRQIDLSHLTPAERLAEFRRLRELVNGSQKALPPGNVSGDLDE